METKTIMAKENPNRSKMPKNKKEDLKAQVQAQVEIQVQAPAQTPNPMMDRKEIDPIMMKANRKFGNKLKRTIAKDSVETTKEWVNKKKRKVKEGMEDSMITHSKTSIQSSMLEETKIKKKKQEINIEIPVEAVEEVDVVEEEEVLVVEIEVDLMTEDLEIEIEEEAVEEEEEEEIEDSMTGALMIVEEEVVEVVEEEDVEVLVVETMASEIETKIQVLAIKEKDKASIKISKIKIN